MKKTIIKAPTFWKDSTESANLCWNRKSTRWWNTLLMCDTHSVYSSPPAGNIHIHISIHLDHLATQQKRCWSLKFCYKTNELVEFYSKLSVSHLGRGNVVCFPYTERPRRMNFLLQHFLLPVSNLLRAPQTKAKWLKIQVTKGRQWFHK